MHARCGCNFGESLGKRSKVKWIGELNILARWPGWFTQPTSWFPWARSQESGWGLPYTGSSGQVSTAEGMMAGPQ